MKWSGIELSLLGTNRIEQDVATIIAAVLDATVYVIAVPDNEQSAQVKGYGESGMVGC